MAKFINKLGRKTETHADNNKGVADVAFGAVQNFSNPIVTNEGDSPYQNPKGKNTSNFTGKAPSLPATRFRKKSGNY